MSLAVTAQQDLADVGSLHYLNGVASRCSTTEQGMWHVCARLPTQLTNLFPRRCKDNAVLWIKHVLKAPIASLRDACALDGHRLLLFVRKSATRPVAKMP